MSKKKQAIILACRKTGEKTWETDVQLPNGTIRTTSNHTGSFSSFIDGPGTCDVSWYDAKAFYETEFKLVEIYCQGEHRLVTKDVLAEYRRLRDIAETYLLNHVAS